MCIAFIVYHVIWGRLNKATCYYQAVQKFSTMNIVKVINVDLIPKVAQLVTQARNSLMAAEAVGWSK